LRDDSFSLQETPFLKHVLNAAGKDSTYPVVGSTIIDNNNPKRSAGLSALANLIYRCPGWGFGFSAGIAASANTVSPVHFLAGFALSLGESQQGMINFGVSAAKIKNIDLGNLPPGPYDLKGGPLPMHDKFDAQLFVGISYAFSSWNMNSAGSSKTSGSSNSTDSSK